MCACNSSNLGERMKPMTAVDLSFFVVFCCVLQESRQRRRQDINKRVNRNSMNKNGTRRGERHTDAVVASEF